MTVDKIDHQPLISVCMAIRNEEKYIAATLQSIQAQTHENFEVLIFDNNSTDDTVPICQDFCASDRRFKLFQNSFNIGQVYNFNRCMAPASADFIAIRSGNDLVEPEYLEKTLAVLLDDPVTGLAYTRCLKIDSDGNTMDSHYHEDSFFETACDNQVAAGTTAMKCFVHPAPYFGLYRKSLLDRLQPLRHIFGSDKIFICEASLYASIACIKEPLCFERRHRRQATLPDIFSEDAVYQLSATSVFARFEGITPLADMVWGFTDMFSRAQIGEQEKAQLCNNAYTLFFNHYREKLDAERARILDIFERNRDQMTGDASHRIWVLNRHRFLHRVRRMLFIFPNDAELKTLTAKLSELL
jgi:glycosyltransferase involved in cell wall biosynthesis